MSAERNRRFAWAALLAILLAASAALAAWSTSPDESLREQLVLVDFDESRHELSETQLRGFRLVVRSAAGALLAVAAGLLLLRRRAVPVLAAFADELREALSDVFSADRSPGEYRWLLAILGVGVALRLWRIDQPMQFDESATYNLFVSRTFFNTVTDYTAPNNHIFHSLLARVSVLLFGPSPPALRLPAFVAGVAVMPLTYLLARKLFAAPAALAAAAVVALHPTLVDYSVEARGYTLLVVCTLVLFLAADVLKARRSAGAWLIFSAAGVAGAYTTPTMIYSLAAASFWLLAIAVPGRRLAAALEIAGAAVVIGLGAAALYAPAAARTGIDALLFQNYTALQGTERYARKLPQLVSQFERDWTHRLPPGVAWISIGVFLYSLKDRRIRLLSAATVGGALFLTAARQFIPYARMLIYAAPLATIAVGYGLADLYRRLPLPGRSGAAWATLALLLASYSAFGPDPDPIRTAAGAEVEALAKYLRDELGDDEAVLGTYGLTAPMRYWFVQAGLPRSRVQETHQYTDALPPLDRFRRVVVVQPKPAAGGAGYHIEMDDPELARFRFRTVEPRQWIEVIHFTREPFLLDR